MVGNILSLKQASPPASEGGTSKFHMLPIVGGAAL